MSPISIDPVEIFFKTMEYRNSKEKSTPFVSATRESVIRELKFNKALVLEAKGMIDRKNNPIKSVTILLSELKMDSFELIVKSGWPIDTIFGDSLSEDFSPPKDFKTNLKDISSLPKLLELRQNYNYPSDFKKRYREKSRQLEVFKLADTRIN